MTDGQITLTDDAPPRGVQPIASATANAGARADVKVGDMVTLVGTARQPPGTGTIVATHTDTEPGTSFASARVRIVVTD